MASVYFNGGREAGQDWTTQVFNSPYDLIPTGVAGNAILGAGVVAVNYSGLAAVPVVLPVNYEKTSKKFIVMDTFGGAAGKNIIVSGQNGETFNGAATYTISTAYGSATFLNFSGVKWNVI